VYFIISHQFVYKARAEDLRNYHVQGYSSRQRNSCRSVCGCVGLCDRRSSCGNPMDSCSSLVDDCHRNLLKKKNR